MPLITRTTLWVCPNCPQTSVTTEARPHSRFHVCPGLLGMTAPFVQAGVKCEVVAVEREDYVGRENVQTNGNGRPIMSVATNYSDGRRDSIAFAPVATMSGEAHY